MTKQTLAIGTLLVSLGALALKAQSGRQFAGEWRGTRSERNPINGQTFTVDFAFEFRGDGAYQEVASLGRLTILKVQGKYALQRGRKAGEPSYTHILTLAPGTPSVEPSRDELRLLQMAGLPNIERTEQHFYYYDLAPAGALTLKDVRGGDTWGLQRVP